VAMARALDAHDAVDEIDERWLEGGLRALVESVEGDAAAPAQIRVGARGELAVHRDVQRAVLLANIRRNPGGAEPRAHAGYERCSRRLAGAADVGNVTDGVDELHVARLRQPKFAAAET